MQRGMEQVDGRLLPPSDADGNSLSGSIGSSSHYYRTSRRRGRGVQQQQDTDDSSAAAERKQHEWEASLAAMQRENKARMTDALEPHAEDEQRGFSPQRPLRRRRGGRSPVPLRDPPQPSPHTSQTFSPNAIADPAVTSSGTAEPHHSVGGVRTGVQSCENIPEMLDAPSPPLQSPDEVLRGSLASVSTSPDALAPDEAAPNVLVPRENDDAQPSSHHSSEAPKGVSADDHEAHQGRESHTQRPAENDEALHALDDASPAIDYDDSLADMATTGKNTPAADPGEPVVSAAAVALPLSTTGAGEALSSHTIETSKGCVQADRTPVPDSPPEPPAHALLSEEHQDPCEATEKPPEQSARSDARRAPAADTHAYEPVPTRWHPADDSDSEEDANDRRQSAPTRQTLAAPLPKRESKPLTEPAAAVLAALRGTGRTPRSFTSSAPPVLSPASLSPPSPLAVPIEVDSYSDPEPAAEPVVMHVPDQKVQVVTRQGSSHGVPAASGSTNTANKSLRAPAPSSPPRESSRSPQPVRPLSLPQRGAQEGDAATVPGTLRPRPQPARIAPSGGVSGGHKQSPSGTTAAAAPSKRSAVYSPLPKRRAVPSSGPVASSAAPAASPPAAGGVTSRGAGHSVREEDSQHATAPLTSRDQRSTVLKGTETYERRRQAALRSRKAREERQAAEEALQMVHTARGCGTALTGRAHPYKRTTTDSGATYAGIAAHRAEAPPAADAVRRSTFKSVGFQRKPATQTRGSDVQSPLRRPSLSATPTAGAATTMSAVKRGSPSGKKTRPTVEAATVADSRAERPSGPDGSVTWAHEAAPRVHRTVPPPPIVVIAAARKVDTTEHTATSPTEPAPAPVSAPSGSLPTRSPTTAAAPLKEETLVAYITAPEDVAPKAEPPSAAAVPRVALFCTSCGEKYIADGARFCAFCGHRREGL